jgi:hypothetical protein
MLHSDQLDDELQHQNEVLLRIIDKDVNDNLLKLPSGAPFPSKLLPGAPLRLKLLHGTLFL